MATGRLGLTALAGCLAGCSLLGYDDFALARCTGSDQCEVLNTRHGIAATACMRFQCDTQSQRCVSRVRDADGDGDPPPMCGGHDCDDTRPDVHAGRTPAPERCDGIDNDCNLVIDEGAIAPRMAAEAATGLAAADHLAYAHGADGRVGVAVQTSVGGNLATFTVLQGGTGAGSQPLGYATNANSNLMTPTLVERCHGFRAGVETSDTCDFGDLAIDGALDDAQWFAVTINRAGCSDGQVRVGYFTPTMGRAAQFVVRGPAALSDCYLGVDRDPARECTGGSRAAAEPRGAVRPSVATLARPGAPVPQSLAAWLGDAMSRAACGAAPVNVEALGLWLESGTSGGMSIRWVNATDTGRPQAIGQTRGGARPAVTSWGDRGWFVGYGGADGAPRLHFAPALATPPAFDPNAAPGVARPTPPLRVGEAFRLLPAGGAPADAVAVAIGAIRTTGVDLGVAWQQGCGTASGSAWFARVRFAPGEPGTFTAEAPVKVSGDGAAGPPTIAYVGSGFFVTGFARGGATVAADTDGGWVVAWASGSAPGRVLARRVSELDAALVAERDIDLTFTPAGAQASASSPELPTLYNAPSATPGLLRYAYHDTARNSLVGGDLLCAPAAP